MLGDFETLFGQQNQSALGAFASGREAQLGLGQASISMQARQAMYSGRLCSDHKKTAVPAKRNVSKLEYYGPTETTYNALRRDIDEWVKL